MEVALSRRLIAEAIGTFGFFFLGFSGIAAAVSRPGEILSSGVALGFGGGLALMIFAFGHISGGHFNPAVSAGLAAGGRFPAGEVLPYWAAQIVGGLVAALLAKAVYPGPVGPALVSHPTIGQFDAFFVELVGTLLFVMVISAVATDKRRPGTGSSRRSRSAASSTSRRPSSAPSAAARSTRPGRSPRRSSRATSTTSGSSSSARSSAASWAASPIRACAA